MSVNHRIDTPFANVFDKLGLIIDGKEKPTSDEIGMLRRHVNEVRPLIEQYTLAAMKDSESLVSTDGENPDAIVALVFYEHELRNAIFSVGKRLGVNTMPIIWHLELLTKRDNKTMPATVDAMCNAAWAQLTYEAGSTTRPQFPNDRKVNALELWNSGMSWPEVAIALGDEDDPEGEKVRSETQYYAEKEGKEIRKGKGGRRPKN